MPAKMRKILAKVEPFRSRYRNKTNSVEQRWGRESCGKGAPNEAPRLI